MQRVRIPVQGRADRLLVKAVGEIGPILEALRGTVMLIGGLMVRVWLHAEPPDLPVRASADIDLGVDRRGLRLASPSQKITPLLRAHGFKPGAVDPEEQFRFGKDIEDETVVVDVLVAPGSSREEPPVLEQGIRSLAAPGLAYALLRGLRNTEVEFVDGSQVTPFVLPMPMLDAAFVLKAALAESGVRRRPDRQRVDAVDSLLLASALLKDQQSIVSLRENRQRSDVKKAVRWLASSFSSVDSQGVRRVTEYFADEFALDIDPEYAVRIAANLNEKIMET